MVLSNEAETYITDGLSAPLAVAKEIISAINAGGMTGSGDIKSDGSIPFTGNQSMGGFAITNLLDPVNPQDAATKNYVDTASGGANTTLSNLTSPTAINRDLLPGSSNSFALGSSTHVFTNLFLGSGAGKGQVNCRSVIGAGGLAISSTGGGPISLSSATSVTISPTTNQNIQLNTSGTGVVQLSSGQSLDMNTGAAINAADPVNPQDLATKNYVDTHSGNILAFTSDPGVGGSAAEIFTVTGLLSTDNIIAVTQKTVGGTAVYALLEWTAQGNNTLTGHYVGDPGPGAVIVVVVMR